MRDTVEVSLERMLSRPNMEEAWQAVKRNNGSAGVDRKSVGETQAHLAIHWPGIREKLLQGTYRPAAVKAVEIPKPNGGVRGLGIPTVQDRLIQQAMHQILSAALDGQMSEHSYGFRPGRSAQDAVEAARGYVRKGKQWVVDIDLRSFFDQVNHDRLLHLLKRRIDDTRVLKLIGRYLRAPTRREDGSQEKRLAGVPQGGPLSPVLANLYLDPLDKELERRGVAFVRYADDIALFVASERSAKRVLASVKAWLRRELDLEVNDDKSGTGRSEETQLLGFRIHAGGEVSVAPKSIGKFKDKVRQLWDARQSLTSKELIEQWQMFIRGWWNYFQYANWRWGVKNLSGWIRRHMRKCFWLRWHNRQGRMNALSRLGIKGRTLRVAGCRLGAWPMAIHVVINQALSNKTLNRYGLALPW